MVFLDTRSPRYPMISLDTKLMADIAPIRFAAIWLLMPLSSTRMGNRLTRIPSVAVCLRPAPTNSSQYACVRSASRTV